MARWRSDPLLSGCFYGDMPVEAMVSLQQRV